VEEREGRKERGGKRGEEREGRKERGGKRDETALLCSASERYLKNLEVVNCEMYVIGGL
jgi:hypothetical protein